MKWFGGLVLLLMLSGCCDGTCHSEVQQAKAVAQQALDAVATITSSNASPAGQAALFVLHDPGATQDRKDQALKLLFELERGRRLDNSADRLDELAAKLQVLVERRVEKDN